MSCLKALNIFVIIFISSQIFTYPGLGYVYTLGLIGPINCYLRTYTTCTKIRNRSD